MLSHLVACFQFESIAYYSSKVLIRIIAPFKFFVPHQINIFSVPPVLLFLNCDCSEHFVAHIQLNIIVNKITTVMAFICLNSSSHDARLFFDRYRIKREILVLEISAQKCLETIGRPSYGEIQN